MLSEFRGSRNRDDAKKHILETDKPLDYTCGLSYRKPATLNKPITKDEAMKIIDNADFLEITEYEDHIHLNSYSCNDMW